MNTEHATIGMLTLLILVIAILWRSIRKAQKNPSSLYVRKIGGIEAIDEAISRSAELGKPVSFCTGLTGLGPVLYACLGVLSHVAFRVARLKAKLLLPQNTPEVMVIVENTARESYRAASREHSFDSQSVQFLSEEQFAFASGYMGLMHREKVGAAFLFGSYAAESLILAEAGQQVGAMQVAASVSPEQVAFFICTCDYTLIGEELFAASSYLGRDPIQLGSLCAQDRAKILFLFIILCGVVCATINSFAGDKIITISWMFG